MPVTQRLADDLIAALQHARQVEAAAGRLDQRRNAAAASGTLMLAAAKDGWQVSQMARVLGIHRSAAVARVTAARARLGADHRPALAISPPLRRMRTSDRLAVPVDQREWLTLAEAVEFTGRSSEGIGNWLRGGLLPNTERLGRLNLFLRADLKRVLAAPTYRPGGIDWSAVREQLEHAPV